MLKKVKRVLDAVNELISEKNSVYSVDEALAILAAAAGGDMYISDMLDDECACDKSCCDECIDDDYDDDDSDDDYDDDDDVMKLSQEWKLKTDAQGRVYIKKEIIDALAEWQSDRVPGITVGRDYEGGQAELSLGENSLDDAPYDDITYYKSTNNLYVNVKSLFGTNANVRLQIWDDGSCFIVED